MSHTEPSRTAFWIGIGACGLVGATCLALMILDPPKVSAPPASSELMISTCGEYLAAPVERQREVLLGSIPPPPAGAPPDYHDVLARAVQEGGQDPLHDYCAGRAPSMPITAVTGAMQALGPVFWAIYLQQTGAVVVPPPGGVDANPGAPGSPAPG